MRMLRLKEALLDSILMPFSLSTNWNNSLPHCHSFHRRHRQPMHPKSLTY